MNKVKLITNNEITKEIEKIFKNELFLEKISNCKTIEEKLNTYSTLPTILIYYYILTNRSDYNTLIKKYNNDSLYDFYNRVVIKEFINVDCLNLNMNMILNLIEYSYLQCFSNRFYTHSFSGALYKEINDNGLDIEKELFQTEYEIINEILPNKQHRLSYNELSPLTFENTIYSPKRFTNLFDIELNLNETIYQSLEKSITNTIININKPNCDQYLATIKRILDYYFKQNKLCIAVFRKENSIKDNSTYIRKIFIEKISSYQLYLKDHIKKYKKEYDKIRYISECTKSVNEKLNMYEEIFKDMYYNDIDLRYSIDELFYNTITDIIVNYCMINNVSNHRTTEKISRSNISIARINNVFN